MPSQVLSLSLRRSLVCNSQHNGIIFILTSLLLFIVTSKSFCPKTSTVSKNTANVTEATPGPLPSRESLSSENGKSGKHARNNVEVDDLKPKVKAPGWKWSYKDVWFRCEK